jgi:hypothetical protein
MDKRQLLGTLLGNGGISDQDMLDVIFKNDLVDLDNWREVHSRVKYARGEKLADSILFNLATRHVTRAVGLEGEELVRTLASIRQVLQFNEDVNFAFVRWLTSSDDGHAVLTTLYGAAALAGDSDQSDDKDPPTAAN